MYMKIVCECVCVRACVHVCVCVEGGEGDGFPQRIYIELIKINEIKPTQL